MKRLFQFLVIILTSTFFVNNASASHVSAADIYYTYLGPLHYEVHVVLYRDCKVTASGFPANASLSNPMAGFSGLHVYSNSCGQDFDVTLDTTGNNTNKIYGDLCPSISNWCTDATSIFPGYEEWDYTADVILPMACTDWVFAYDNLCCRNSAISNLVAPTGQGLCLSAGLNNVVRPINSSPKLTIKPIPYVCVNLPKVYLNGPVDPDLDSLNFVVQQPLTSGSCAPITWAGTSTTANPLGAAAPAGYVVDPTSGTASFTPIAINTYALAFKCWDIDPNTGDTVGYTMRDVQINVLNCNAAPPSALDLTQNYQLLNLQGAAMQTSNPIQLTICPGTPMSFDIQAQSNSGSNLILTSANNAITCIGSNYTMSPVGGGNPVTGTFTWTPTAAQIGNHTMIIQFTDSTCSVAQPIVLKSYCVVQIKVLPGIEAGPDLPFCIGRDSVQLGVTAPPSLTQWSWTDINGGTTNLGLSSLSIRNPKAAPTQTTTYIVTALNPPAGIACKTKDTVTIIYDNSNSITASVSPSVLCAPGLVTLDANAVGIVPFYKCGEENAPCLAPYNQYTPGIGGAVPPNIAYSPFANASGGKFQYIYTIAELNAAGITRGNIEAMALNIINKTSTSGYNMNIKMGCTALSSLSSFIPSTDLKQVGSYSNYNTVLGTNTFNFPTPFLWEGTQNLVVEICFFMGANVYNNTGDEVSASNILATQVYYNTSSNYGCDLPNASAANNLSGTLNIRPDITFSVCDVALKTWPYRWTPSTFIFDTTAKTTTAYIDQSRTFYVYATSENLCIIRDSVSISFSQHGLTVSPTDTTVCLGDAFNAFAYGTGNAASQTYTWFNATNFSTTGLSCVNCSNPVITPSSLVDSVFACARLDSYNCSDTAYIHINVNATPSVSILNGDSITIKYLQDVNLIATGAQVYNWSPVWGSSNPNMPNTIVSPQENTMYTVYGINEYGCGATDSILVNIDYANNLFVPSAFSPNGDGINDVFRVTNLTFQKIQEFRIMNRWGQEVFNANDNRGWNGTFKGKEQNSDVYHYLIRVAMPDGPVKLFKGDVTIIR